MAAASYTTDLVGTGATGDEASGWIEFSGTATDPGTWGSNEAYSTQGAPAYQDPDYPYIQGSFSVTQDCTKDAGVGSLAAPTGGSAHGTDGAYFVWHNYMVASNIGTYAQGGLQVIVGTDATNFEAWFTGGSDKAPYPYGGWVNHVANTTVTSDTGAGTLTTENYAGSAVYVTIGSSKGEVHNVDQVRWGRGSAIFTAGELNGINGGTVDQPATFSGFAAVNDTNANRWGLIQGTSGGYLWKGRMSIGTSGTACVFKDSNKSIFLDWTPKVTANFNLIEVINTSTYIEWNNLTFQCLDATTASRGRLVMTNEAKFYISSCTFVDMDTFSFADSTGGNVTISDSTFRRCNGITIALTTSGSFARNLIANSTATSSVITDDLNVIDDCSFTSDGSNHAVELTSLGGGTMSWNSGRGTNYATTNGSTGNETIFVNVGTGSLTIQYTGTAPSIRTAGATVTLSSSVTSTITIKQPDTTVLQNAQVAVYNSANDTQLANGLTNASGQITFTSAGGLDVYIRVRKSTAGSTRYIPVETTGSTGTSGLLLTITMVEDLAVGA